MTPDHRGPKSVRSSVPRTRGRDSRRADGTGTGTVSICFPRRGDDPHPRPSTNTTFKISPDPFLIDKVRDVVGLYLAPPANAVVF
ncbi:hypothetical protein ACIRO3_29500, partial [Streptomyces sp. NPDC102278]